MRFFYQRPEYLRYLDSIQMTNVIPTGPSLHSTPRACHCIQKAFQGGAGWWKASFMVHLWTQREAGVNHNHFPEYLTN